MAHAICPRSCGQGELDWGTHCFHCLTKLSCYNAIMVATMNTRPTVDGTVPLARSSLVENNNWNNSRSSRQTRSISLVHPPGPGEQRAGASRRHFPNAFESNWRGLAGWKSNTSRKIADTGFCGRRSSHVAAFLGALDTCPLLTLLWAARALRKVSSSDVRVDAGFDWN